MVQSLGWEDPLEEGVATHSIFLPWRVAMDRRSGQATVLGDAKSQTGLSTHITECKQVIYIDV